MLPPVGTRTPAKRPPVGIATSGYTSYIPPVGTLLGGAAANRPSVETASSMKVGHLSYVYSANWHFRLPPTYR